MILLVEDNPHHAMLTVRALRKCKFEQPIVVARDGIEALDYLFARGEYAHKTVARPTIIFLDLNLPALDGINVLREIRKQDTTRLVPVVILSSSDEATDVLNSYSAGANSYVRKPIDTASFEQTANQLGTYWLQVNHCAAAYGATDGSATAHN